ncbi:MAG: sensor domain-containing diguanylate cyclase [Actinomycetota bacterium]|uniref:Sensor domain-containing diguanylate cyclase n=1 Tax=Mycobacterium lentiflavum TaxID=141349 RepID=A0ABY3UVS2_MYCLN|nr:sensor domain-containing diguanylate cyclase [Mycobacterium lentiflavum]MEE3064328.1 sensor domain-containing diguanylate cyclase [Actinomycetota bacterium]ULP43682.1 sensor domain-containing diguanylate cyclase [Mycobacterium lentiflavum]
MHVSGTDTRLETALPRFARGILVFVIAVATVAWVGWTTGVELLTRLYPTWPVMTPWTALCLAALGVSALLQSGQPSRARVWTGRCLAVAVVIFGLVVLAEFATGRSFGLDQALFGDAVRLRQSSWPGRPSPQTAVSLLFVAATVALVRLDRGVRLLWPVCMAAGAAIPLVTVAAYLFDALALVGVSTSTGQAMATASTLLLVVVAASLARPDRPPLALLVGRPDWRSLVRLVGVLAAFPLVVALSRAAFVAVGLRGEHTEWTLSIVTGTVVVGAVTFYLSQREQKELIQKELVGKLRTDAENRYRILADNAVDIIVHLRGREVAWVSPSVVAALGGPPQRWLGAGFSGRIHDDDVDTVLTALRRIADGESVVQRFRILSVDSGYRWVDGHAKPYVDADGNTDGAIAALRLADDQVEAERRLERLAHFDTLTGLANRAEIMARLEAALAQPLPTGTFVGVLFCDVDHFKDINDTWGHGVGDIFLATLAARIGESVRRQDSVGRTGGDEILIVAPDIHGIDELAEIAEKIRRNTAEPIDVAGNAIRATLSIGSTIALPGEPVSSVMGRADAAMYQEKPGDTHAVARFSVERSLRRARRASS